MKLVKYLSIGVYAVGAVIAVSLLVVALFGSTVPNHSAMLFQTAREVAFMQLAVGAIPMLIACAAVYGNCKIAQTSHRKRNTALIFLYGLVCAVPFLIVAAAIAIG